MALSSAYSHTEAQQTEKKEKKNNPGRRGTHKDARLIRHNTAGGDMRKRKEGKIKLKEKRIKGKKRK